MDYEYSGFMHCLAPCFPDFFASAPFHFLILGKAVASDLSLRHSETIFQLDIYFRKFNSGFFVGLFLLLNFLFVVQPTVPIPVLYPILH